MTTVLPPRTAEQPAHITARIFVADTHPHAHAYEPGRKYPSKSLIRPYFYRGAHRRPWSVGAKMGTLGLGLIAILVTSSVTGIRLLSAAW